MTARPLAADALGAWSPDVEPEWQQTGPLSWRATTRVGEWVVAVDVEFDGAGNVARIDITETE